MSTRGPAPLSGKVGAAGIVLAPFVLVTIALTFAAPPSAEELLAADPLVQLADALAGVWVLIPVALIVVFVLATRFTPSGAETRRGLALGLAGAAAACAAIGVLRLAAGPELPSFIPPEESSRPGVLLGLHAGVVEEALFRLTVLPIVYTLLNRRVVRWMAILLSVLITGFLFALAHEVGPGAGPFDAGHFATRVIFAGPVTSALFFWPGPAFIVSAHCTAHVVIPFVFL